MGNVFLCDWPHDTNMRMRQAKAGDAHAQWYMSHVFLEGDGVPRDIQMAVVCSRLAAQKGFWEAMGDLSDHGELGRFVPLEERAHWATQWAKHIPKVDGPRTSGPHTVVRGQEEAPYGTDPTPYLADIRRAGERLNSDDPDGFVSAMISLKEPAERGVALAEYEFGRGCLMAMGMTFTVRQAQQLQLHNIRVGTYSAAHWLSLASKHGHGTAAVMLGDVNAQGIMDDGEPNMTVAASMYARAQRIGYPLEAEQLEIVQQYSGSGHGSDSEDSSGYSGSSSGYSQVAGSSSAYEAPTTPSYAQSATSTPMPPMPAAPIHSPVQDSAQDDRNTLAQLFTWAAVVVFILGVVVWFFYEFQMWMLILAIVLFVVGKVIAGKGSKGVKGSKTA